MKVLSIACGNGVICYPFKRYLVAGVESRSIFKTPNDIQWKENFGKIPLFKSFEEYLKWHVTQPIKDTPYDLVIGAPDCGHSSMMSLSRIKKFTSPKKNESLMEFLQAIKHLLPKVFMMENLPKLLETFTKEEIEQYFNEYQLVFHETSVFNFGNSQKNRIRLILIGIRRGFDIPKSIFTKVYKVRTPKFAGKLIDGLVYGENGHNSEDPYSIITLYSGFKISLNDIRYHMTENDWKRWPAKDRKFQYAPGVYRNRENEYPNVARKANRQFNHWGLQMSPRELARIMGIPDRFKIHYDYRRSVFWINKGRVTATKTCPMEIPIWLLRQMRRAGFE